MNRFFLTVLALLSFALSYAQEVDVDRKSGLVTVNGREFCYIVPTGAGRVRQFNVQNLQRQDLILVTENEGKVFNSRSQAYEGDDYRMVFLGTHNWCTANSRGLTYNNYLRIARLLVDERLIQDNSVHPEAERLFVRKNQGIFNTRIEPGKQPAQTESTSTASGAISGKSPVAHAPASRLEVLQGDKYLIDGVVVGTFTRKGDAVQLYSANDVKVATAVRKGDEWELHTPSDEKRVSLRYYEDKSIERLFRYLQEKNYL
ncbi:MAG: hypothetical protein EOO16_15720 [Chitinophagaceae bacterium]|nr:MAG: hypothetical protein EOO16_15720 [Chitinophagaceae bacterium]